MPYKIDKEENGLGVVITFHGEIEGDEIHKINEELMLDALFSQWRYQIWDFSEAEKLNASFDELRNFARQDAAAAQLSPNQKLAIIPRKVGSSHMDGVFHVYQKVWGGYESQTFANLESAKQWVLEN